MALAQYRELAAFAQFASDLDEATRKQLERGQRVMESMKQNQYQPMSVAEIALILLAVNEGYLDDVELKKVVAFERALLGFARAEARTLLDKVNANPDYKDEVIKEMRSLIEKFKATQTW